MNLQSEYSKNSAGMRRALLLALLLVFMISGSVHAEVTCGGGLGKLLFREQIEKAKGEWKRLDRELRSCVTRRMKASTDELAEQCVGPEHSRISKAMKSCRATVAKAKQARQKKERQVAAAKAARKKAEEEARQAADAAKAEAEARQMALAEQYGELIASEIVAGNVVKGMTPEQVVESLGQPLRVDVIDPGFELWVYETSRVVIESLQVKHVERFGTDTEDQL
jgi:multidrug efflux pump subunit AcrA (membrane-fusion protein)